MGGFYKSEYEGGEPSLNWFEGLWGWRENTDLNAALHGLRSHEPAVTGRAAQLRVIHLKGLLGNISGTFLVPLLVSNCFLENFSQPPNVPPELEGWDLPEKAAVEQGLRGFRDRLLLPVLLSLRGSVKLGRAQGADS